MEAVDNIPLSEDATLVTALAGTAMSFSHSGQDEAERWLRTLRLHGEAGQAMQSLGLGESPLEGLDSPLGPVEETPPLGQEAVDRVVHRAEQIAAEREAKAVCTADLLLAVLDVYGTLMERVLRLRGSSSEELVERLAECSEAVHRRHEPPTS